VTETQESRFKVVAAYKFFDLKNALEIRFPLRDFCKSLGMKGTILLASEGLNSFLAGTEEAIETYKKEAVSQFGLPSMTYKEHFSHRQPFTRMLVKIKKEIISTGMPDLRPADYTAPALSPNEFKKWLDEKKEVTVFDTRNHYEVKLGKFKGAIDLNVRSFREFAAKSAKLPDELKSKPVVMYCTGGIRCEKAGALFLQKYGFKEVYQLQGGILNYFKVAGDSHFEGECMVFDHRVGIDANDSETNKCFVCESKLSFEDIKSADFIAFKHCPHCKNQELLQANEAAS